MSKLAEYRQLERHLAEQLKALEAMKGDKALEAEIEFEGKLRTLLGNYNKSLKDVISILDAPSAAKSKKTASAIFLRTQSPLPGLCRLSWLPRL